MGKDLSIAVPLLYPLEEQEYKPLYGCCNILRFNRRDYDKYEELDAIAKTFEDSDNVFTDPNADLEEGDDPNIDPYGNRFKTVEIQQFLNIYKTRDLTLNDKAICVYLKALPQDLPIVLYYT